MGKNTTVWIILAVSLILVGCIVFGGVMAVVNWDFSKLSTTKYETIDYVISEYYQNISVLTDTADVTFVPSGNAKTTVICYEQKNAKHTVSVAENTLAVKIIDARKWYEHIGITFSSPKITVYIPEGEYGALSATANTGKVEIPKNFRFESIDISGHTGDIVNYASASNSVSIKAGTGDIRVENISAGTITLSVSTGKVTASSVFCRGDVNISVSTGKTDLTDIACQNIASDGNTGDVSLKRVIATERFFIERSTGDVDLDRCDAAQICIKTTTGDVEGSFQTGKVFSTQTNTGDVDVPASSSGGKCEVSTNTGDIKLSIEP